MSQQHITFLPANSELSDQNKEHVHDLPLLIHQRLMARWYRVGLVTERLLVQYSLRAQTTDVAARAKLFENHL